MGPPQVGVLLESESYKARIEGCARVFRYQQDSFASQVGTLLITCFRLRFVPKPCRCKTLLGPPNWHSGECEQKGPVSPWGTFFEIWPPSMEEMNELLSTPSPTNNNTLSSESSNVATTSTISDITLLDMTHAHDVPLYTIRKIIANSRELKIFTRDGRTLEFELSSESEVEGITRLLSALSFPKDEVLCSFAFQNRYRVGLGWDVFDMTLDASKTLEPRSSIPLKKIESPCETYPKYVWIPTEISNSDILGSLSFRSMGRFPVPVWAHPKNGSLLIRSAQPLVGLLGNRNTSDEKLMRALAGRSNYLLLDARSRAAALGNRAMGKGTESVERGYEGAKEIVFCDLGNIHQIKACFTSFQRCIEMPSSDNYLTEVSAWLGNVAQLLKASIRIVQVMDRSGTTTWTHCSDGWDRTSQMCSLAQIMMEPDYRTRIGFAVVIEKNFASFGFKFRDRGRGISLASTSPPTSPDPVRGAVLENDEEESSPVLFLFIDCCFQLLKQFPERFEYNESFLVAIMDAYFSGRFGTFLCNSERERIEKRVMLETRAVWDYVCTDQRFRNISYIPFNGTLYPSVAPRSMKLFEGFWKRFDPAVTSSPMKNCFF